MLLNHSETGEALLQRVQTPGAATAQPKMDLRNYGIGAQISKDLGVTKMKVHGPAAQDAQHGRLRPRGHRLPVARTIARLGVVASISDRKR